jgi:hypothetical protein
MATRFYQRFFAISKSDSRSVADATDPLEIPAAFTNFAATGPGLTIRSSIGFVAAISEVAGMPRIGRHNRGTITHPSPLLSHYPSTFCASSPRADSPTTYRRECQKKDTHSSLGVNKNAANSIHLPLRLELERYQYANL